MPVNSSPSAPVKASKKFLKWKITVIVTLLILYTGYYFNRSNISVATPQILLDTGLNKTDFGTVLR